MTTTNEAFEKYLESRPFDTHFTPEKSFKAGWQAALESVEERNIFAARVLREAKLPDNQLRQDLCANDTLERMATEWEKGERK